MTTTTDQQYIRYLFEPRSIAVIGASDDRRKIGCRVLENILAGGYPGRVYPVNPRGVEICGIKAARSLAEIDGKIDMAVIAVPAKLVYDAVKECAGKHVKFLPVITSGFSEVGNIDEEKRIAALAREYGMRILGPNIFGIYSGAVSLNATFGPKDIRPGGVAIVTQSGALGLSMIGKTAQENIGLSAIVSVGNKTDIDEADLLEYLIPQKNTRVIMMYIEGVKNGEKLLKTLKKATAKKPVIVIKSGRSKRGAMAAASHTGSLAGVDEIFDDIMRQCGVLRAESVKEAFNWCKYMAGSPLPAGENTVIITNGGGIGVMATDAGEKYGVKLYDDPATLKKAFSGVTPDFGSLKNPIDLTGQATSNHYNTAFDAALKNKNINSVIGLYCETAVFDGDNLPPILRENYEKYKTAKKPIVFSVFGGKKVENSIETLRTNNVPVFGDVYEAVSCLGSLYTYHRHRADCCDEADDAEIDVESINKVAAAALQDGRNFLLAHEGRSIMQAAGINMPRSRMVKNLGEAIQSAQKIGYPVVMKIVSRDILHKSDAGGIALDLENLDEVIDAYQAIIHNCKKYKPDAILDGIEISEMVAPGTETIIGARRDKSFGPIVMFGLGGIYVEVMKDIAFRALPLNRKQVRGMIKQIRSYPLLLGVRGEKRKDINGIIETVIKMGAIIQKCPAISDIEINPLVVYEQGEGVRPVDVRVLLANPNEVI
ncbi:MAG: acetate--CoA ligase family protein [Bacillota bacterium]